MLRYHVCHVCWYCISTRVHIVMYCISALCMDTMCLLYYTASVYLFLPARASEQGNVIRSVRIYIYIYMYTKKNCNLVYLKFVAKDFFPKIISSSAGENAGDSV